MEIVQNIHGIPKIIRSDRDPIFNDKLGRKHFLVWVLNWLTYRLIILNLTDKLIM